MNIKLLNSVVFIALFAVNVRSDDLVLRTIRRDGYVPEVYKLLTPDDYILRVVRVRTVEKFDKPKGVVFMMHCLMCSCGCYIAAGNQSLAYNFAKRGYDVWLGNGRGTRWTNHRTLSKDNEQFWNYSLDEIGGIDLPSMIDFVLKRTKSRQIHYIGHSMGGATFMILMATHPEYASRIKSAYLMAPAMSVGYSPSELMQTVVGSYGVIRAALNGLNYQYFPVDEPLITAVEREVKQNPVYDILFNMLYFNIVGTNSGLTDWKRIFPLIKLILDTMSVKQLLHFHQFYVTQQFKMYDYNDDRNIRDYGTRRPPQYNITSLPETLVTFFGTGDALVTPRNAKSFFRKVKRVTRNYYLKNWNHLDFQFSRTIKPMIFDRIIKYVEK